MTRYSGHREWLRDRRRRRQRHPQYYSPSTSSGEDSSHDRSFDEESSSEASSDESNSGESSSHDRSSDESTSDSIWRPPRITKQKKSAQTHNAPSTPAVPPHNPPSCPPGGWSDLVTINLRDKSTYKIHRHILLSVPFFRNCLEVGFQETAKDCIDLNGEEDGERCLMLWSDLCILVTWRSHPQ
jgi:hypothetical protein